MKPNSSPRVKSEHTPSKNQFILRAEGRDYRTFRVSDLLENSPATEAGLQESDIITAIDGRPAAEFTLTKINEMFERPVAYKLTLQRGGQAVTITLTPRKLI